jgi:hypothetical protein
MPSTGLENHVTTIKRKRPKKNATLRGPGESSRSKKAGDLIKIDAEKK